MADSTMVVEFLCRGDWAQLALLRCPPHRGILHPFPYILLPAWLWGIGCLMFQLNGACYARLMHWRNGGFALGVMGVNILCLDLDRLRFGQIRVVVLHWRRSAGRLPRFDPHRLRSILRDSLLCRKVWNRIIGGRSAGIRMGLQSPSLDFFLALRQLCQLVHRPLGGCAGNGLGTVSLRILLLPALGGVPELALQLFRPGQKTAPEKLLRRGLDLFFCAF